MVFIDGVKYACATCIKGHRSTACQHSDRPLFVIKRKGRPITQCSHCRELRKTQKVHVKCNCKERKMEESSSQTVAVLPQGISTNVQSTDECDDYQPVTGDKTSVGALLNPCQCLTGAECICCRPVNQHRFIDKEFATSDTSMNNANINNNSAQTPLYILPPISRYDNTKSKNTDPFTPPWANYCNNSREYSGHNNSSAGQRDNSYTSSSFTSDQNVQDNSSERRYSSSYDDKDNTDSKYRDQSEVLGEEICLSSSTDLANLIYGPFQSCSSAMANGSCCGSDNSATMISVCRCGSGCKCKGCDTHAERINVGNYYNNTTFQQNQSSSGCCSSHEITQPEHTVIRDEDGVLLCGCGCQKLNTECSDCLENLCEEYLLKQP